MKASIQITSWTESQLRYGICDIVIPIFTLIMNLIIWLLSCNLYFTERMFLIGLCLGPFGHLWYTKFVEKLVPGAPSTTTALKKILADQIIAGPFFCSAFFFGKYKVQTSEEKFVYLSASSLFTVFHFVFVLMERVEGKHWLMKLIFLCLSNDKVLAFMQYIYWNSIVIT